MNKKVGKIIWKSEIFKDLDLDSICVVNNDKQTHVLVTSKSTNSILVFDYKSGKLVTKWVDKWNRPNGIANYKNYVGIVERDGKKLSIYNYLTKEKLFVWGQNILEKPYGISMGFANNYLYVLITDDGNKTVHKLTFQINKENTALNLIETIPIIKLDFRSKLESIYLDINKNKILLADESKYLIYIYEFASSKLLDIIGKEYFTNEPEGISKYSNYYICTQQSKTDNRFYFLNQDNYQLEFQIADNANVSNTDGICVFENTLFVINKDSQLVAYKINI